jgi:hypothetical protein
MPTAQNLTPNIRTVHLPTVKVRRSQYLIISLLVRAGEECPVFLFRSQLYLVTISGLFLSRFSTSLPAALVYYPSWVRPSCSRPLPPSRCFFPPVTSVSLRRCTLTSFLHPGVFPTAQNITQSNPRTDTTPRFPQYLDDELFILRNWQVFTHYTFGDQAEAKLAHYRDPIRELGEDQTWKALWRGFRGLDLDPKVSELMAGERSRS